MLTVWKRIVLDTWRDVAASRGINAARAAWQLGVGRLVNILHRLSFTRGSEALDFVRTLRERTNAPPRGVLDEIGPVLVYGALIVAPDAPAELFVSLGALTLAHALGIKGGVAAAGARIALTLELPADMALLFTASVPDEISLH